MSLDLTAIATAFNGLFGTSFSASDIAKRPDLLDRGLRLIKAANGSSTPTLSPILTSGNKLVGANIIPNPSTDFNGNYTQGGAWTYLISNYASDNSWVRGQIDLIYSLGGNCIRLITTPDGVIRGRYNRAFIIAQLTDIANYLYSKGMWFYPCLGAVYNQTSQTDPSDNQLGISQFSDYMLTVNEIVGLAQGLANVPNIIGFDLLQEFDYQSGQNQGVFLTLAEYKTLLKAVWDGTKTITNRPCTFSSATPPNNRVSIQDLYQYACRNNSGYPDYFDGHSYSNYSTLISTPFSDVQIWDPSISCILGEGSRPLSDGQTAQTDWLTAMNTAVDSFSYCKGSFYWATKDQNTVPSDNTLKYGLFDNTNTPRTYLTNLFATQAAANPLSSTGKNTNTPNPNARNIVNTGVRSIVGGDTVTSYVLSTLPQVPSSLAQYVSDMAKLAAQGQSFSANSVIDALALCSGIWDGYTNQFCYQDTAATTAVTAVGQDVKAIKPMVGTENLTEATSPPYYGAKGLVFNYHNILSTSGNVINPAGRRFFLATAHYIYPLPAMQLASFGSAAPNQLILGYQVSDTYVTSDSVSNSSVFNLNDPTGYQSTIQSLFTIYHGGTVGGQLNLRYNNVSKAVTGVALTAGTQGTLTLGISDITTLNFAGEIGMVMVGTANLSGDQITGLTRFASFYCNWGVF